MRTLNLLLAIAGSALLSSCAAQIKNTRTVNLRIDGDCGMCETRIEDAGNVKGEAQVSWDPDTKQAAIAFDSTRTNLDAILKRISLAGYDTPNYLAPDAAYAQLPSCCQYERTMKHAAMSPENGTTPT
ncbi:MAG TPA: heavy-metal-associated domain-containing protein, partial [Flavobacteriales bacterium]|nr:heavy-metal-associated domain-containing protein [Flavobacteriales bacterium]